MIFKSYQNLFGDIMAQRHDIPSGVSEVIGIPRSGLIPAAIISHLLNVPFRTLPEFIHDIPPGQGITRKTKHVCESQGGTLLLVDDSIHSGRSMRLAFDKISKRTDKRVIRLAVYGISTAQNDCDITLTTTEPSRVFEWNIFHRRDTTRFGFDLDGVFCPDPSVRDNDDGKNYLKFISDAPCILKPTFEVGAIITSRLEKYRPETEAWLDKNGIKYSKLLMLNGVTAEQRRQQSLHHKHKIRCLKRNPQIELFIESDSIQAQAIAKTVGIPAYCTDSTEFFSYPSIKNDMSKKIRKAVWKLGW